MPVYTLNLPGVPTPQARARVLKKGWSYDPLKKEKDSVRWKIKEQFKEEVIKDAVWIEMSFCMPIPKSLSKKKKYELGGQDHIKKPDIDNLAKFYLDCMKNIVLEDDCLVTALDLNKYYGTDPMTTITVIC